MIRSLSFKADPPTPFHTMEYHHKKAFKHKLYDPWIDLDTKQKIVVNATKSLIELLKIPNDYNIFFLKTSFPLNQALNKIAKGSIAIANTSNIQESFRKITNNFFPWSIDSEDLTSNEINDLSLLYFEDIDLFTGVKINFSDLEKKHKISKRPLIHCDISNSVPTEALDFQSIHSFFFQAQYGFGLMPGICIGFAKDDVFEKIILEFRHDVKTASLSIANSTHRAILYEVDIDKLYVLGMVAADMLNRGINIIRNEIKYKSIIIQNAIKESLSFEPLIQDLNSQSKNIFCATTKASKQKVVEFFTENDVELDVYQDVNSIIRIANYPVHSKEQTEYLADLLGKF